MSTQFKSTSCRLPLCVLSVLWLVLLLLPARLAAHSGAHGVVMDRMEMMLANDEARAAMEQMLFGEEAFDAELLIEYARTIEEKSGDALTKLFPAGSLQGPSLATPDIWRDWDGFTAHAQELQRKAALLASAAERHPAKDDASLVKAFEEVSQACDSCHMKYRVQ